MFDETPDNTKKNRYYTYPTVNATNNKGLDGVAKKLEIIYTTIDWPFKEAELEVSLHQSGKSRADLWQLAGLVALEQTLERANRACDLDYHARQQVKEQLHQNSSFFEINHGIYTRIFIAIIFRSHY